ncbi:TetR/AcrR family transcriptional regulator [Mycolicibacterium septicum]|uniref:TetR/AcrR family transcriptional regulator n=1 Tax=Mycolicibacterium septicum DSM 44393 TaxID=1341646 RepID=A0A7X6MMY3_9MYCO|nr:TetR/AcrR family transcriptional regulator [Mycolicibacterium septicum]NKZ11134.1 TetR/AcrR family transcriptional regulator [Mycolicibacterium septicum DSM 44393]QRY54407.1 TetR/AcrR family transcriptional regulator [Mycolicibacterium septicum]
MTEATQVTETTSAAPKLTMRDRHRIMTREHIMAAALEAFAERGYVPVTIDDIVRRAGIGRATFYLHFDSKAAVLRELRNTRMTVWSQQDAPRGGPSGRPSIRAFFEKVVDFYTSAPELYTALHQARAADPEFATAHRATMEANVDDWIQNNAMPGATEAQLRLAIAMMYTMVDSFMHLWLVDGWPLDREAAIEAMTDALYATMR